MYNETKIKELLDSIIAMPEEMQNAMKWIAQNYDFAVELCGGEPMSTEMRKKHIDKAIEDHDALRFCLVVMEMALHCERQ